MSIEDYKEKIKRLNDFINAYSEANGWTDYCESLQRDYDRLIIEYNNKIKEQE